MKHNKISIADICVEKKHKAWAKFITPFAYIIFLHMCTIVSFVDDMCGVSFANAIAQSYELLTQII